MIPFLLAFIISYYIHGFGITIGYHRLLAHRSYKCPKFIEYCLIMAGYLVLDGSPIWWAAVHRVHHSNADTELDPHSPMHGRKHAYFGWIFDPLPSHIDLNVQCPDLVTDRFYQILEKGTDPLMLVVAVLFRVFLWMCFGWQVAVGNILASILVLQLPLVLNLFCHIPAQGYKNFDTRDDSVNVWWVALLTGGDGWHNNHHAFPGSARSGFAPDEFDLSWEAIKLLRRLGLASSVNEPSPNSLNQRRARTLESSKS